MASRPAVLLVEDDAKLAALVREYLARHDVDVTIAGDGETALQALGRRPFALVLLDVMLPGADGFEVLRRLRAIPAHEAMPVIMLTARGDEVDRIVGLELGADDYLPKPFNPRELLARMRAVWRRGADSPRGRATFRSGGLVVDFDAREVTLDGRRVTLTHHEFELLATLARAAGRVLSREQLMDVVAGREHDVFDRSIDVHVSKLRAKIEANPREPRYVKTVRGTGYTLVRHP